MHFFSMHVDHNYWSCLLHLPWHLHRITPKLAMWKCPLMGIKYSIKSQLCNDKGLRHEIYIKCHRRRQPSQQNDDKLRISSFQQLSYADPMPSVQSFSYLHNQIYCHLYHLVCCSQDFVLIFMFAFLGKYRKLVDSLKFFVFGEHEAQET